MTIAVVELLLSGLTDNSGEPLSGGLVYTYAAGTTTPKDTYTDNLGATPEANPVVLDSNGRKKIYADGAYKFVVKTSAGATLYTWDDLYFSVLVDYAGLEITGIADGAARDSAATVGQIIYGDILWGGLSTGAANTYAISLPFTPLSYNSGMVVNFTSHQTNTGASTLNVDSLGAIAIKKWDGSTALDPGDIVSGQAVSCIYAGAYFQLQQPPVVGKWTSWTPTLSAVAPLTLGSTSISYSKYMQIGKLVIFQLKFSGTAGGTDGPIITFTPPVTAAGTPGTMFLASISENGAAAITGSASLSSTTLAHVYKYNAANYVSGYTENVAIMGFYEAA